MREGVHTRIYRAHIHVIYMYVLVHSGDTTCKHIDLIVPCTIATNNIIMLCTHLLLVTLLCTVHVHAPYYKPIQYMQYLALK